MLKAAVLFWCRPKQYGPQLAAAPFKRAFQAHVLAMLIAAAVITAAVLWSMADPLKGLATARRELADEILDLSRSSAGTVLNWSIAIIVLGIVPQGELALLALGTFIMPFGACGDRASSVWKRCVKSAYWSTTAIIPVSVLLGIAIVAFLPSLEPKTFQETILILMRLAFVAGISLLAFIAVATALAVSRYVGPADGPAFSPREPHCEDCGYLIIGLSLDSRCPECGTAVRESLPGGRRRPTAWQQHEFKPRGYVDLLRTHWAVLRGNDFFRRLPVHSGLPAARHYWWVSWAFFIVAGLAILRAVGFVMPDSSLSHASMSLASILMIIAPLVLQSVVMIASCLWAQFRFGIRDYRVSAIVCYHAVPLIWPLALTLLAALALALLPATADLNEIPLVVIGRSTVTALLAVVAPMFVLTVAALAFWWFRLLKALRSVRFANV
jgi:hypothetical protein